MSDLAYLNYLNLWDVLVNKVCGSPEIFLAFFFFFIAIMCAKFRAPNLATFSLFIIGALFISPFFIESLILALFVVAIFFSWSLARFLSKK